jgi:glutamine synthetase
MSKAKFFSALDGGFGFCDVVLGWDSNDQLFDNVKYTGWHTAYPDAWVRVVPETCREIPFEDNTLFFPVRVRKQGRGDLSPRRPAPRAR